jgi:GNAT superfamily N-acetyltransferase
MAVTIRPMTAEDVATAKDVVLTGGWGDRRVWFTFAVGHAQCRPFVAEEDGEIIGTAVGTINGNAGWVGTIFVAPAARGRGVGSALTDATVDALDAAGCRTQVLVATNEGRPIYERRGFVVETFYFMIEAYGTAADVNPLRPLRREHLEQAVELDRQATGEDRAHLIREFASDASTHCLEAEDGALRGFAIRAPWGGWATVAPTSEDGLALLDARRAMAPQDKIIRAGVLAENQNALEHLLGIGWRDTRSAPRLIRGDPLDWRPTWLWGQFNFALG